MSDCGKEREITMMNKAIFGNGRAGLVETTARMSEKMDSIENSMKAVRADVKVLLMFQTQMETNSISRSQLKTDKKWIFTSLIAITGLIFSLLKDFIF